jgi:hypothetical protein
MSTPSKTCRDCGGTEFYTGESSRTVAIAISFVSLPPKFNLRVCGTCGLMDWFLPPKDVQKLKKKFTPEKV